MSHALFISGTDTGVGKTAVACGIASLLRRRGLRVGVLKPVETGHGGAATAWPTDAKALAAAAGFEGRREEVVPYVFAEALAPGVAAQRAGVEVDVRRLDAALRQMVAGHDVTLVEGAGGLAVPLTPRLTMAGLAARWRLPVLLVARAGLGTINHTVLSVEHARSHGLEVIGVILNGAQMPPTTVEATNPDEIERLGRVRVLGVVPRLEGVDVEAGSTAAMADALASHVDMAGLENHWIGGVETAEA